MCDLLRFWPPAIDRELAHVLGPLHPCDDARRRRKPKLPHDDSLPTRSHKRGFWDARRYPRRHAHGHYLHPRYGRR